MGNLIKHYFEMNISTAVITNSIFCLYIKKEDIWSLK